MMIRLMWVISLDNDDDNDEDFPYNCDDDSGCNGNHKWNNDNNHYSILVIMITR